VREFPGLSREEHLEVFSRAVREAQHFIGREDWFLGEEHQPRHLQVTEEMGVEDRLAVLHQRINAQVAMVVFPSPALIHARFPWLPGRKIASLMGDVAGRQEIQHRHYARWAGDYLAHKALRKAQKVAEAWLARWKESKELP